MVGEKERIRRRPVVRLATLPGSFDLVASPAPPFWSTVAGAASGATPAGGTPVRIDAAIFDLDGVLTDTASIHAAAWKQVFDSYLQRRVRPGERQRPFDIEQDYRRHVDGRPREDGVRAFLASRGIELPRGEREDPPERETIHGIAERKDQAYGRRLQEQGVEPFPSTVRLIESLRRHHLRTAVFSASRNCAAVLRAAHLERLFDAKADGVDAERLGLPGKPDPALLIEAARRIGAPPARTAVFEDALAGVQAGRRGGFALVVGIDRTGHPQALREAGADLVVADLSELALQSAASGDGDA